ncbi:MAG TPA: LLM class flavin-dependent oxidoreductase [Acidimicrobiales bacterium]|nr:LLM class flavin-dependent oxidoreductase [Acidimicrobiales bacterium]
MPIPSLGVRVRMAAVGEANREHPRSLVSLARTAEDVGADAFFVDEADPRGGPNDPFVLLGALSAATSTLTLGCIANRIGGRPPSMVAKSIASLDVLSDGRALGCLGLPDGDEHVDSLDELTEALSIVRLMLDVSGASFLGSHYAIDIAFNEPRSERQEPVPLGVYLRSDQQGQEASRWLSAEFVGTLDEAGFIVARPNDAADLSERGVRFISLVEADDSERSSAVADRAKRAFDAGHAGVVLDWATLPSPDRLVDVVTRAALSRPS